MTRISFLFPSALSAVSEVKSFGKKAFWRMDWRRRVERWRLADTTVNSSSTVNQIRVLSLFMPRVQELRPQLDDQRVLVKLLVQPRLEFVQHRQRCADDFFGYFFVEHKTGN